MHSGNYHNGPYSIADGLPSASVLPRAMPPLFCIESELSDVVAQPLQRCFSSHNSFHVRRLFLLDGPCTLQSRYRVQNRTSRRLLVDSRPERYQHP